MMSFKPQCLKKNEPIFFNSGRANYVLFVTGNENLPTELVITQLSVGITPRTPCLRDPARRIWYSGRPTLGLEA